MEGLSPVEAEAFAARFELGPLFCDEVESQIEIEAPRELVWSVLTDFENYPLWNPFTPGVEGRLAVGASVTLDVRFAGRSPRSQTEWINRIEAGSELWWGVRYLSKHLLAANREQRLEELGRQRTRYYTADRFSGLLVPLVFALYGNLMQQGFDAVSAGLKKRCEALHSTRGGV